MKIAIIGAGAIGGYVGAKLSLAGDEVTFVARGANLDALRLHGMRLIEDGNERVARDIRAVERCAAAGPQDLVILAVKAHQLDAIAPDVVHLLGRDTAVVTMQNGIPFWYFHRHGGVLEGTQVRSVDPTGMLGRHVPPQRVIGCVVYPACELAAPGVVRHVEGNRFPLGELDGTVTARVTRIADAFTAAGLKAPVLREHPRRDLAQALGQPELQPDQRAHAFHARGHLPRPADAGADARDDDGSPGGRGQAGHHVPRAHRQAHRGRRKGRRPQDVDAAGRGSRTRAGDRRAARIGGRACAPHRNADAAPRRGVRADQAPCRCSGRDRTHIGRRDRSRSRTDRTGKRRAPQRCRCAARDDSASAAGRALAT